MNPQQLLIDLRCWTALHAVAQSGVANNQAAMDLALTRSHQSIVDVLEKSKNTERPSNL